MRSFLQLFLLVLISAQLVSCAHQGVGEFFKTTGSAISGFGDKIINKAKKEDSENNIKESFAVAEADKPKQVNSRLVVTAQSKLSLLGYNLGAIDGICGPKTSEAIKAFQRDNKMPEDGKVTAGLIDALQSANKLAQHDNKHPDVVNVSSNESDEKQSIDGVWTGYFYCDKRKFDLDLTIKKDPKTNHLSAEFDFSSTNSGTSGRVAMSGRHKVYGNLHFIKLSGSEWVEQPNAPIQDYNFNGNFEQNYSVLTGKITDCGEVLLSRGGAKKNGMIASLAL